MIAPTWLTERLTLRMPVLADLEPRAACSVSDRSICEGGAIDARRKGQDATDVVIRHDLRGLA
jgi:hypothetical protein